jgi:hypothetical protein
MAIAIYQQPDAMPFDAKSEFRRIASLATGSLRWAASAPPDARLPPVHFPGIAAVFRSEPIAILAVFVALIVLAIYVASRHQIDAALATTPAPRP